MKNPRFFNQAISFMLALMLLTAAGGRSWSDCGGERSGLGSNAKKEVADLTKNKAADSEQAKLSTLSLDAVITPAISFDFSHYFYFLPQPDWHFVAGIFVVKASYQETFFLFTYFHRIFGRFIVTNAP